MWGLGLRFCSASFALQGEGLASRVQGTVEEMLATVG